MNTGLRDRLAALPAPTVDAVLRLLRDAFAASGAGDAEGARAEARIVVGHVLGLDLTGLVTGGDRAIDAADLAAIADLGERRLAGEPVQRVVGRADFFGLRLALSPATLVPRPDTETLVEAALERLSGIAAPRLADLGTGSGAILLALLHERPDASGVATDLSEEALATARANAENLGLSGRAVFVRASFASTLEEAAFDAILSNPPYIETDDIDRLDAEVRLHDPRLALDGGADGLEAHREIGPQAFAALKEGGFLAVEIGWRQGRTVAALFAEAGFAAVEVLPDLAGRDRVVVARKPRSVVGFVADAK